MPLHSTCPVLTPIIYNEINFGVHTSYVRFVDGKGAIVVNLSVNVVCSLAVCSYLIQRGMTLQTRDVLPRLCECWASVAVGGPTFNRRWVNVSCVLGRRNDHAGHYIM